MRGYEKRGRIYNLGSDASVTCIFNCELTVHVSLFTFFTACFYLIRKCCSKTFKAMKSNQVFTIGSIDSVQTSEYIPGV